MRARAWLVRCKGIGQSGRVIELAIVVPDRPGSIRHVMTFVQRVCPPDTIDIPRPDATRGGRFEVRVAIEAGDADEIRARLTQEGLQIEQL